MSTLTLLLSYYSASIVSIFCTDEYFSFTNKTLLFWLRGGLNRFFLWSAGVTCTWDWLKMACLLRFWWLWLPSESTSRFLLAFDGSMALYDLFDSAYWVFWYSYLLWTPAVCLLKFNLKFYKFSPSSNSLALVFWSTIFFSTFVVLLTVFLSPRLLLICWSRIRSKLNGNSFVFLPPYEINLSIPS